MTHRTLLLATTTALTLTVPALAQDAAISQAKIIIEHNATDLDTGFQGFVDAAEWRELTITAPKGDVVANFSTDASARPFGLTELFFETVEPEHADMSLEDILAMMPAGDYRLEGVDVDGNAITAVALLTHDIPAGPQLLSPAEDAEVEAGELVFSWEPVGETIAGAPADIVAYQLIVEKSGDADPHWIGTIGFSAYVPATVTELTLPAGVLEPGSDYEWEVLAIEKSGNQTLTLERILHPLSKESRRRPPC